MSHFGPLHPFLHLHLHRLVCESLNASPRSLPPQILFPFDVGQFGVPQFVPFHFQLGEQVHEHEPPLIFGTPFPLQSFEPVSSVGQSGSSQLGSFQPGLQLHLHPPLLVHTASPLPEHIFFFVLVSVGHRGISQLSPVHAHDGMHLHGLGLHPLLSTPFPLHATSTDCLRVAFPQGGLSHLSPVQPFLHSHSHLLLRWTATPCPEQIASVADGQDGLQSGILNFHEGSHSHFPSEPHLPFPPQGTAGEPSNGQTGVSHVSPFQPSAHLQTHAPLS